MIDFDTARSLAEDVILERGKEYIYINPDGVQARSEKTFDDPARERAVVSCYMWDNLKAQPSCLVGQIFYRWGVEADRLATENGIGDYDDIVASDAYHFLSVLQIHQDQGKSWGEAYDLALAAAEQQLGRT